MVILHNNYTYYFWFNCVFPLCCMCECVWEQLSL